MKMFQSAAGILLASVLAVLPVQAASRLSVQKNDGTVNGPGLKYEYSYPRLGGIGNANEEQKLNIMLKEKAIAYGKIAEFTSKSLSGTNAGVNGKFDYTVKRNAKGVLSVVMKNSLSASGKRGMDEQTAVTIDTVDGSVLKLKDFFIDNADYRERLCQAVTEQVKKRGLEPKLLQKIETISPNEDFYVTDNAIVLFFNRYRYFPYECGVQEFSVPLNSLDGILRPEYGPVPG